MKKSSVIDSFWGPFWHFYDLCRARGICVGFFLLLCHLFQYLALTSSSLIPSSPFNHSGQKNRSGEMPAAAYTKVAVVEHSESDVKKEGGVETDSSGES